MEYWVNDGKVIVATHRVEDSAIPTETWYAESIARKDALVSWMQTRADNPIASPVVTAETAPTTDEQNVIDAITGGVCSKECAKKLLDKHVPLSTTPSDTDILKAIQGIPL